jgi:hypothetical protein
LLTKRDTCSVLHFTATATACGTGIQKIFDGVCTASTATANNENITRQNLITRWDECS